MHVVIGVDGCRAGWIAVTLRDNGQYECQLFENINSLWAASKVHDPALILIDIPIGLPESSTRACDLEARRMLRARASSIFMVPTRPAIYADAYAHGAEINQRLTGKRFSRQVWGIAPKIREVDALIRIDAFARAAFKETHPELIFTGLAGKPPAHPKKTEAGYQERVTLLEQYFPRARELIQQALDRYKRSEVARDDVVDALVAAVAAQLGTLTGIPATPEPDAQGLPMQIMYARPPGLVRLHHAQITIPAAQETEARAFYCDLLGLREIPKPDSLKARGGFWVKLGDVEIHISLEEGVDRTATKAHLAYQVNDLASWQAILEARGIKIGESTPIPGYNRFEFRDPFGNRVEFIQPL